MLAFFFPTRSPYVSLNIALQRIHCVMEQIMQYYYYMQAHFARTYGTLTMRLGSYQYPRLHEMGGKGNERFTRRNGSIIDPPDLIQKCKGRCWYQKTMSTTKEISYRILTPRDFLPENSNKILLPKEILRLFISLNVLSKSFWIRLSSASNFWASCGWFSSRACWARERTLFCCSARSLCKSEYNAFPACVSLRALLRSTISSCRRSTSLASCLLRIASIIFQAECSEFAKRAVEAPCSIIVFQ